MVIGPRRLAAALLAGVALTAACRQSAQDIANGPGPMRALAQRVPSQRYGGEYRKQAADRDSALWGRAVEFCAAKEGLEYPNCAPVRMVAFLRGNTAPARTDEPFSLRPGLGSGNNPKARSKTRDAVHDSLARPRPR